MISHITIFFYVALFVLCSTQVMSDEVSTVSREGYVVRFCAEKVSNTDRSYYQLKCALIVRKQKKIEDFIYTSGIFSKLIKGEVKFGIYLNNLSNEELYLGSENITVVVVGGSIVSYQHRGVVQAGTLAQLGEIVWLMNKGNLYRISSIEKTQTIGEKQLLDDRIALSSDQRGVLLKRFENARLKKEAWKINEEEAIKSLEAKSDAVAKKMKEKHLEQIEELKDFQKKLDDLSGKEKHD